MDATAIPASHERALRDGLWCVIPLKLDLDAKSRLAAALPAGERSRLMLRLWRRTVNCVVDAGVLRVCVVARGVEAVAAANAVGAAVVLDEGGGPNHAVAQAAAWVRQQGARTVAVIAADLPLLRPESVATLIRASNDGAAVIAPDRLGGGTNALVTPAQTFPYAFGPGSFRAHSAAAIACGWRVSVVRTPGLGVDLDEPSDLDLVEIRSAGASAPPFSFARA